MRAAAVADDLDSDHVEAPVLDVFDVLARGGLVKARPAGPGFEFGREMSSLRMVFYISRPIFPDVPCAVYPRPGDIDAEQAHAEDFERTRSTTASRPNRRASHFFEPAAGTGEVARSQCLPPTHSRCSLAQRRGA